MKIKIDIAVNLDLNTVVAFAALVGEPTEKAIAEYILANGVTGLECLVTQHSAKVLPVRNIA